MRTDTHRTLVWYTATLDRFHICDYRARPGNDSWVVVQCEDEELTIEQFSRPDVHRRRAVA